MTRTRGFARAAESAISPVRSVEWSFTTITSTSTPSWARIDSIERAMSCSSFRAGMITDVLTASGRRVDRGGDRHVISRRNWQHETVRPPEMKSAARGDGQDQAGSIKRGDSFQRVHLEIAGTRAGEREA